MKASVDILRTKMIKRGIGVKALELDESHQLVTSGLRLRVFLNQESIKKRQKDQQDY